MPPVRLASRAVHGVEADSPYFAAIGTLCATAPGAPIGGCAPPHPASNAATAPIMNPSQTIALMA